MSSTQDELIDLAFSFSRIMHRKMAEVTRDEHQVKNWLQMHALCVIEERPGITMKDLAGVLMITAPTATTFVARLVRLGCVQRVADPKNRKLVRLRITKQGRALMRETMQRRMTVLRSVISHLSPKDQADLARIYRKLIDSHSVSPHA
jgi:DNA-binding MarR family transcriptional regulator